MKPCEGLQSLSMDSVGAGLKYRVWPMAPFNMPPPESRMVGRTKHILVVISFGDLRI
jgi:hypothetical protein